MVLELIGTPDANRLLEKLSQGSLEAHLTKDAKTALLRLAKLDKARASTMK